ncbi:MAG: hypothetical protein WKF57_06255 [Nakamurella sp.]
MSAHVELALLAAERTPIGRPVLLQPIPKSAWGLNLRRVFTPTEWDRLRKPVMAAAGNCCEYCGGIGQFHPVECHEWWAFDESTGTVSLRRLITLCPDCHAMQHFGFHRDLIGPPELEDYLIGMNGWTRPVAEASWRTAIRDWERRTARTDWVLDTSVIGVQIIEGGWRAC